MSLLPHLNGGFISITFYLVLLKSLEDLCSHLIKAASDDRRFSCVRRSVKNHWNVHGGVTHVRKHGLHGGFVAGGEERQCVTLARRTPHVVEDADSSRIVLKVTDRGPIVDGAASSRLKGFAQIGEVLPV